MKSLNVVYGDIIAMKEWAITEMLRGNQEKGTILFNVAERWAARIEENYF
jgi:hypothetical protein